MQVYSVRLYTVNEYVKGPEAIKISRFRPSKTPTIQRTLDSKPGRSGYNYIPKYAVDKERLPCASTTHP